MLAFTTAVLHSPHAGAATSDGGAKTPVILDTDMYSSADDVGAEASLFALNLLGEDNVIAIGVNTRFDRPAVATDSWKCVSAIAQFYGYPNVPIGADMPDNGPSPATNDFITPCAAFAAPGTPAPLPAVEVYRRALVSQPDDSVVLVGTGYEENYDNLLNSPADSISPLDGSALIAQKVKMLVLMGGGYPSRDGENNFEGNAGAAADIAENWPTKIVYSGYEVGSNVFTGETVSSAQPADSPVRAAIEAYAGADHAIESFDMTAAYHAIRPNDADLTEVGPGTNAIDETGDNTFTLGAGDEYYLSLNDATDLEASIEALLDQLPGTTTQTISFTSTVPTDAIVGGSYDASATGGASGNPVTLSIDASSTSGCTIGSDGTVTFSAPKGTCVVDANEPGDTTYAPALAQQSITVAGDAQAITFTSSKPVSPSVGAEYHVTATGGASANPVTFSIDPSSTSGCTIDGSGNVTFTGPAGSCVIDANEAGNGTYAAAPEAQQTVTVEKLAQAIDFTSTGPSGATVGDTYLVTATGGGSDLAVTFSIDASSTSGCTIDDTNTVTLGAPAGTCVIDANEAGNGSYAAAPQVQQSLSYGGDVQTVSFTSTPPSDARVGGSGYRPTASASSGLGVAIALDASSTGCTLVSGVVDFVSVGTCVLDATQAGNTTFDSASTKESIVVGKGESMITITSSAPAPARAGRSFRPTATSTSGDAVDVSLGSHSSGCAIVSGAVELRAIGTCVLHFTDPGSANYDGSMRALQLRITPGPVHLDASVSPSATRSGGHVSLTGTVSVSYATGTVAFTAHGESLCTAVVRHGTATCRATVRLSKGTYRVLAAYSGSASFLATRATTTIKVT